MKSYETLLPHEHDLKYGPWRAEDLPLPISDLLVRETPGGRILPLSEADMDDVGKAQIELDWRYGFSVSRAAGIVLERHGYKEVVTHGRLVSCVLDIVFKRHYLPHVSRDGIRAVFQEFGLPQADMALDLALERGFVAERPDGTLIPTSLGSLLWDILPPDLRSVPEASRIERDLDMIESGKLGAAGFLQAELSRLPALVEKILSTEIEDNASVVRCPTCGGFAHRLKAQDGHYFWRCQTFECSAWFPDDDGKLAAVAECPKCGRPQLSRFESRKKLGTFFWRCAGCEAFFGDADGRPGEPFGDEETAQCPTCDKQAVRRKWEGGDKWYWRCQGSCGNFRDDAGKIGANCGNGI